MIYPLIQKNNLSGDNVTVSSVALCGDYEELALRVFNEYDIATDGGYAILYPQDSHKPGVAVGAPSTVKKIVGKVRI